MLDLACRWIDDRLDDFRIEGSASEVMAAIKAVAELAHAAGLLSRADPASAAIGRRWMAFASDQIDGGERIRKLIASEPTLLPAAVAYLPFALDGRDNPALAKTCAAQLARAELPPLGWTLVVPAMDILGVPTTPAMGERADFLSILALAPDPDKIPQDAAYLLAHECFYATRWGLRPPPWAGATGDYVDAAIPALIDRFAAAGDVDVVAELVLALHVTSPRCAASEIWELLASAQTDRGELVNRAPLATLFPRLEHPRLPRSYHTTLNAIMAWAGCRHQISSGRTPS